MHGATMKFTEDQLCIFKFFCPALISRISMLQLVTTSALDGFLSYLFPHALSAEQKHELFTACCNTSNLLIQQKAEQPLRIVVIQSRLYRLHANSRQSIDVNDVPHPVYLFVVY